VKPCRPGCVVQLLTPASIRNGEDRHCSSKDPFSFRITQLALVMLLDTTNNNRNMQSVTTEVHFTIQVPAKCCMWSNSNYYYYYSRTRCYFRLTGLKILQIIDLRRKIKKYMNLLELYHVKTEKCLQAIWETIGDWN
jgi:hypothetical protein